MHCSALLALALLVVAPYSAWAHPFHLKGTCDGYVDLLPGSETFDTVTVAALMKRAREGDPVAQKEYLDQLNQTLYPDLLRIAKRLRIELSGDEIANLRQEIMIAIIKSNYRYQYPNETKASYSTWMYAVIRNKIWNYAKQRAKRRVLVESDILAEEGKEGSKHLTQIEAPQQERPDREYLHRMLALISPRQRRVAEMIFLEHETEADIARKLSLSRERVRQIKDEVLEKLKQRSTLMKSEHYRDIADAMPLLTEVEQDVYIRVIFDGQKPGKVANLHNLTKRDIENILKEAEAKIEIFRQESLD